MEEQLYGLWGSGSATSEEGAAWGPIEPEDLWPLGGQIRQMLGEGCELDPSFFEEIWTSGRAAVVESRQRQRDRPAAGDFHDCTFAELSGAGSLFFTQERGWSQDCRRYAPPAGPTATYAASWLQEPLEELEERIPDRASSTESAAPDDDGKGHAAPCPMEYRSACELLSVSRHSTEAQIKTAYRRMAGQWHPDRLERNSDEVRAFAARQMTAINQAYGYLRSHTPVACC